MLLEIKHEFSSPQNFQETFEIAFTRYLIPCNNLKIADITLSLPRLDLYSHFGDVKFGDSIIWRVHGDVWNAECMICECRELFEDFEQVCGVWCVVCGVWCVVCGVWCVVCGVWCVVCGVWCAVWCVVCGVWCMACDAWCVVRGVWRGV